jgi:hypothetical protein
LLAPEDDVNIKPPSGGLMKKEMNDFSRLRKAATSMR